MATTFAERLASLRDKEGISMSELAEVADVNRSLVWKWEHGTIPRADMIRKLADILGVSAKWLLTGDEDNISNVEENRVENTEVEATESYSISTCVKREPERVVYSASDAKELDDITECINAIRYMRSVDPGVRCKLYDILNKRRGELEKKVFFGDRERVYYSTCK